MNFTYPYFLSALLLIAIPIIIHLFNFRRYKTVYFTNVRFLKNINDETTNKSKLKHLLVLASRILAFIFLVLAFAQPYIPISNVVAKKGSEKIVSIYVDNSFSMNAVSEEEPLLQAAKKKVQDIIAAYGNDVKFQLLTNDFEPKQQRLIGKDDVKSALDEIKISPVVKTLEQVKNFQQQLLQQYDGQKLLYWLSDFQKNSTNALIDTSLQYFLIPLQAIKQQNIFIDSCWLEKPVLFINEPNRLFFKIANASNEEVKNVRVNLNINNQNKALTDVNIASKSFTIDTLSFSIQEYGWLKFKIFINDFPVTFDDDYYMTFKTYELMKVLAINEQAESNYLKALFFEQKNYQLENTTANNLNIGSLNQNNLVVINNLSVINSALSSSLQNYIQSGGTVLLFPSPDADLKSYNEFLNNTGANSIAEKNSIENEVSYLNPNSDLLKDVFEKIPQNIALPKTNLYYNFLRKTRSNEQVVLGLKNNSSFLSEYNYGSGKLVVCASPLGKEYSDFAIHATFVPLVYKMASRASVSLKTSYVLGRDNQIELIDANPNAEAIYKIKNDKTEWIPGQRSLSNSVFLSLDENFKQSGFFEIVNEKKQRNEWVALNFNRTESNLETYTINELKEKYAEKNVTILEADKTNFTEIVQQIDKGIALWKVCIILALICLAAEVLLLRFLA